MTKPILSTQEENLIKDLLKHIGNNVHVNRATAQACDLPEVEFDSLCESIFRKLGNGRVILVTDEDERQWDRESAAPDERAASDANERTYGGSGD